MPSARSATAATAAAAPPTRVIRRLPRSSLSRRHLARCAALASGAFDLSAAQKLWHRFGGIANALVPRQLPSSALWLAMGALAQAPERWAALVAWLLRAPSRCRRGFPDLTLLSRSVRLLAGRTCIQVSAGRRRWLDVCP